MNTYRYLLTALTLLFALEAHAKGGPGGAFATALEVLSKFAIVAGLFSAVLFAGFARQLPQKTLITLTVIALICIPALPFFGFFLGISALICIAVFIATFLVLRDVMFKPAFLKSYAKNQTEQQTEGKTAGSPIWIRWLATSYLSAVLISLMNFSLLAALTVPVIGIFFPETIKKFLPFLLPPLAVAIFVSLLLSLMIIRILPRTKRFGPIIFHLALTLSFFTCAEFYRDKLMSVSLLQHKAQGFYTASFLNSVLNYRSYFRSSHAGFNEGDKSYIWSYAERKFIAVD